MSHLSNADLRAILAVLVNRLGGTAEITNTELYGVMTPTDGTTDRIDILATPTGVRVTIEPNGLS